MPHRHQHSMLPAEWLSHLEKRHGRADASLIKLAMDFYAPSQTHLLKKGVHIANLLLTLELDNETLIAAILYPLYQAKEIATETITEKFNANVSKTLEDVMQMQSLGKLTKIRADQTHQIENLRKLLLAMVTDVRSILIVLAERLWQLYEAKNSDVTTQQELAKESAAVYAPLANRLGVWQLKWEIEDVCLRYLQPDIYKSIAKWLAARREERENYIEQMIQLLNKTLTEAGVKKFNVTGRVKHIYSIYAKMQRKNVKIEQIYDVSALRVLVNTIEECYYILGVLQNQWQLVAEEFDDYINHPKPNGYRSIHTVIIGPEQRYIEVQIRTHQMHQECELGVAAHWRYKEGATAASRYEAKIALLRQLLAWQREVVSTDHPAHLQLNQDLLADLVYVFTPLGDIIDLPQGATPLDFAYTIHSEVGHRCKGAKVNGKMVPLTYPLQTGQRVEILTAKVAHPSRDWLNPHLGYLKSPRARAKVAHWFRVQDSINQVNAVVETPPVVSSIPSTLIQPKHQHSHLLGIDGLLTHIANCCKPLPGDAILGYVTRNRGVSVHRLDCTNVKNMQQHAERLMEINWNNQTPQQKNFYSADIFLKIMDRTGLLRDITTLLASEKINIVGLQTQKNKDHQEIDIHLTIEIAGREQLSHALEILNKIPSVIAVKRL